MEDHHAFCFRCFLAQRASNDCGETGDDRVILLWGPVLSYGVPLCTPSSNMTARHPPAVWPPAFLVCQFCLRSACKRTGVATGCSDKVNISRPDLRPGVPIVAEQGDMLRFFPGKIADYSRVFPIVEITDQNMS
jgi:ribosomal protein S14